MRVVHQPTPPSSIDIHNNDIFIGRFGNKHQPTTILGDNELTEDLPASARKPGGGVKVRRISPKVLAKKILRAAERKKPELIIPAKARLLFVVAQLFPRVGDWILRRWT